MAGFRGGFRKEILENVECKDEAKCEYPNILGEADFTESIVNRAAEHFDNIAGKELGEKIIDLLKEEGIRPTGVCYYRAPRFDFTTPDNLTITSEGKINWTGLDTTEHDIKLLDEIMRLERECPYIQRGEHCIKSHKGKSCAECCAYVYKKTRGLIND